MDQLTIAPHLAPTIAPVPLVIEGTAYERVTLDEGPVQLEWPSELSVDSVEEFEYWVAGLIKRAKRKAGMTG